MITVLFQILFFIVPLILWPYTSELFEFNKMVIVYIFTTIIVATWIIKIIKERKIIFRRTILDIPLLVFLGSQIISTLISIDPRTSWFGYYSRFNGGLLSIICYLLLYWGFVSNINKDGFKKIFKTIFWSASIVSIYGVMEHFGIDKNIWQQDVQSRVFSTLGQPNWLAAWLTALIPTTWAYISASGSLKIDKGNICYYFLSGLFFAVLLFTKSRSGLLGFGIAAIIYWSYTFIKYKLKFIKPFLFINGTIILLTVIIGTQWTPGIGSLIKKSADNQVAVNTGATVLETGGTESVTIRKIVWKGAIDVWRHYPIFGTGVETFGYSYYLFRPAVHNMTSEWDYIYNKAHNEYLNYLANTGTFGILAYLVMIGFAILVILKNVFDSHESTTDFSRIISLGLFSGYASILVTNFSGFSVVPIQLQFYLYPAFALVLLISNQNNSAKNKVVGRIEKITTTGIVITAAVVLYMIGRYWFADFLYAKGLNYNRINRQDLSPTYLVNAIKISPYQGLYYSELSKTYASLALAYNEAKETTISAELTKAAISSSQRAVALSPANVNYKRAEFSVFVMLATLNPNYLLDARDILLETVRQAPTDAKLFYNLGLIYSRLGQSKEALDALEKAVELKTDYSDARLAYAILLISSKGSANYPEARAQLEYVLTNLDPENTIAKQYLQSIK